MRWPLVWRSSLEAARLENFTLRDALRNANEELAKHRKVLAGLRAGDRAMTEAVEKVFLGKGAK